MPNKIGRLYSLDTLRGIAALSVVLWHWHQFFGAGDAAAYDPTRLPLYPLLFLFYHEGALAVDLFFMLSGFVFYWLYSRPVAEGNISPGKFALLRFSRLYPLHFATLMFVAAAQLWLMDTQGSYFVVQHNDGKHFLLNLFFISSWGLADGVSFNGPVWSVSVEVFLYALFFACCRLFPIRPAFLALGSVVGYFVVLDFNAEMGRGIGSFFYGGCVFLAYQAAMASRRANTIATWAALLTVAAWVAAFAIPLYRGYFGVDLTAVSVRSVAFLSRFDAFLQWGIQTALGPWPVFVLFPMTIFSLALVETLRGPFGRRVSFLGDISYSAYMLHFPLQIIFSVAVARIGFSDSVYYSPWFMGIFLIVLLAVSLGSFWYFEVPAQRRLRSLWRGSGQPGPAIGVNHERPL